MKKLFTLMALSCLFGVFGARAITVTFQCVGISDAYSHINWMSAPQFQVDNNNATCEITSETQFTFNANPGYKITNFGLDGGDMNNTPGITVNNPTPPPYVITINPLLITQGTQNLTFQVVVMQDTSSSIETITIPFSLTPTDWVESKSFSVTEATFNSQGEIEFEYDPSNQHATTTGWLTLMLSDLAPAEDMLNVEALYSTTGDDPSIPFSESDITKTEGMIQLNIDFTTMKSISVKLSEAQDEQITEVTVNFSLYAPGLQESANSYVQSVTENGTPMATLTGYSFSTTYSIENNAKAQVVEITLKPGYIFTTVRGENLLGTIEGEGTGTLTITCDPDAENNDVTVEMMIAEDPTVFVTLTIDEGEYEGLVSSYRWGTSTIEVNENTVLSDIELPFQSEEDTGILYIYFSTNSEKVPYYIVSEMNVAINIDGKVNEVKGSISEDYSDAFVEIPGNADFVGITFKATENEAAGINSLNSNDVTGKIIYNLNGVRVNGDRLGKGLYIINGKKVIVK